jgi:hypothetical protein
MVAGGSRLGETSGSASDERLHLEEVPAFRISSGQPVGENSGTASGVQGIGGVDPGVARDR